MCSVCGTITEDDNIHCGTTQVHIYFLIKLDFPIMNCSCVFTLFKYYSQVTVIWYEPNIQSP